MDPRIDPEIAAALERMPEGPLEIEGMRRTHLEATRIVSGDGPPVARAEDLAIPGPAGEIPGCLYVPSEEGPPPPLVVYLHGGGWAVGSKASFDPLCRTLALAAEAAILYVEYRLAPEDPFPAAVTDAWAAVVWAAEHAEELGCAPGRLAVAGDSAGGSLAAAVTRRAREAGGPQLAAQLLVYPAIDPRMDSGSYREYGAGFALEAEAMAWYWESYLGDADPEDPDAAPARLTDLSELPPAIIILAELDPLHDEGARYAHGLEDARVPVLRIVVPGAVHGFWRFLAVSERARETVAEAGRLLGETLAA